MIKVYYSDCSRMLSVASFKKYLSLLTPEMRQNIMQFYRWEDQQASLYGKLLLMKSLEEAELESSLRNLQFTRYGRPFLNLKNAPDFNISHAGCFSVCAISFGGRIGVDIEEMIPIAINSFKEQFSEEDWKMIVNSDDVNYQFYHRWTAKEALLKADGRGFSLPLSSFQRQTKNAFFQKQKWYLKNVSIDDRYMMQVASDQMIEKDVEMIKKTF